MRAGLEEEG